MVERYEHYVKQTYRNRCRITTANGEGQLIVPTTSKHGKVLITDVRIDYTQKWLNNHWRTIRSAYGKAAFFEHYADDIHNALFRKADFLYDLNYAVLSLCLKWLKWDTSIAETPYYVHAIPNDTVDLRSVINPKKLEQCYQFYYPVRYNQVFGNTFVDNLSIIDLIFCEGPGAADIIRASAIQKMNK